MARLIPLPQDPTFETVWDGIYTARIVKDQTTNGIVTVAEENIDFGTGNINISIGEDMQNPLAVSFTGMPDLVSDGDQVTLSVVGDLSVDALCRWYVNGTKVGDGTSLVYTFGKAGICTVSLLVLDGDALSGYAEPVDVAPSSLNDIYVAGQTYDAIADEDLACYWKNDGAGKVVLGSTSSSTYANAIALIGEHVYAAGYEYDGSSNVVACYWTDGSKTVLGSATSDSEAIAIAAIGEDVYVTGEAENDGGTGVACYWKNGANKTELGLTSSSGKAIAVVEDVVYIAGYEYDGDVDANVACYWTDGEKMELGSTGASYAHAIAVIGADVFVAGMEEDDSGNYAACYWKNGNKTVLELTDSYANAMAIVAKD